MMPRQNRREFLKNSAIAAGAAASLTVAGASAFGRTRKHRVGVCPNISRRVLGANDRVRIAMVGINGRGQTHINAYSTLKNVEIAYFVDADSRLFEPRTKKLQEKGIAAPKCVQDLRKALDDKTIDAVSIATTNHSHSLLAIWACQAGKDVYVEKPCSHNIFEGRKLVEAARKYDCIVQHGTQSRSNAFWQKMTEAVRSGKYGKLLIAYGYASKPRGSIGFKDPKTPPEGFDFDIWLGPAQQQPYHENIVHYNWHWFWDFGNGEIGNQGIHQLDIARWGMPEGAEPKNIISLGGRFGYKDQGQTPNTQLSIIDFGDVKLFFEDRGLVDGKTKKVTNEFYTDQGVIKDGKFFAKGKTEGEPVIQEKEENVEYEPNHFGNFVDCVRSRKRDGLHAEILEGHKSAMLAHLANTSYRLGTEVPFSQENKAFGDDKAAYEAFDSMKDHLTHAANLKLEESVYRLGRTLKYDAKAEKYIGDEEANKLLTRQYRQPYVVPETV
jgi:predicted dehydrogenase